MKGCVCSLLSLFLLFLFFFFNIIIQLTLIFLAFNSFFLLNSFLNHSYSVWLKLIYFICRLGKIKQKGLVKAVDDDDDKWITIFNAVTAAYQSIKIA